MEIVWHSEFDGLFKTFFTQFRHQWQLAPLNPHDDPRAAAAVPGTKVFRDSAKVRFLCKVGVVLQFLPMKRVNDWRSN
jgi:hypothetical protein